MDDDARECAYIRLKGATTRLLMILDARIERNYEIAMQAVETTMAEYRAANGQDLMPVYGSKPVEE